MSHLRYAPPSRWRVDQWRQQIEEAACGGVENVWPRLAVVIKDMRKALDMEQPLPDLPCDRTDPHPGHLHPVGKTDVERWCPGNADDGKTDHCGCCGHSRASGCGGHDCPCSSVGATGDRVATPENADPQPAGNHWATRLSDGRRLKLEVVGNHGRLHLTVESAHRAPALELYLDADEARALGVAARMLSREQAS